MPKKPLHPTKYPPQTRASSIQAFASIIARSVVRIAQSGEIQNPVEPEVKHKPVHHDTSVKRVKNVVQLSLGLDDED